VSPLATVASNVTLGADVRIGPFAVVGRDGDDPVSIGEGTVLEDHVLIEPGCEVGADCVIEDHCRIGRGSVVAAGSRIRSGVRRSNHRGQRHRAPAAGASRGPGGPVSPHALLASNVVLGTGAEVDAFAIVGWEGEAEVRIGDRTKVSPFALIEPGAVIGDDCLVDAYCRIASGAVIGHRTQVLYGAGVFEDARIGEACIIGGNVADRTVIEDCVTHFGEIAHAYRNAGDLEAWDTVSAPSPVIRACTVIGQYAVIVGGVEIGRGSYISAGEVVKVDVPPAHLFQNGVFTELRLMRGLVRARTDGPCA
jgi:UDP-3-O-[3-hydroxymyristoyl] glucosamine N-acyltransferase